MEEFAYGSCERVKMSKMKKQTSTSIFFFLIRILQGLKWIKKTCVWGFKNVDLITIHCHTANSAQSNAETARHVQLFFLALAWMRTHFRFKIWTKKFHFSVQNFLNHSTCSTNRLCYKLQPNILQWSSELWRSIIKWPLRVCFMSTSAYLPMNLLFFFYCCCSQSKRIFSVQQIRKTAFWFTREIAIT